MNAEKILFAAATAAAMGVKSVAMWLHAHGMENALSRRVWANRAKRIQRALDAERIQLLTLTGTPAGARSINA